MGKLLKAIQVLDDTFTPEGIVVVYRVGGDDRSLYLSEDDISGLTNAQIKTLAQTRADADTKSDGSGASELDNVVTNPIKAAQQYFASVPALVRAYYLAESPAAMRSIPNGLTTAQKEEVIFYNSVINWVFVQQQLE